MINISSGQQTPTGQADRILADAVRRCADAGKLIVAAAGNDGCRCVQVPGSLETVLAVGACDLSGEPLPFSNFGAPYLNNGILAPGQNVKGASPTADVAMRSGTSFATPIVTGVVALLLSYLRQSGRDADPLAVRAALLAGAAPCNSATVADGSRSSLGASIFLAPSRRSLAMVKTRSTAYCRLERQTPQKLAPAASSRTCIPLPNHLQQERGPWEIYRRRPQYQHR